MKDKPFYDPKKDVKLTRVEKRGEHYHVEGVAEGRRTSVVIPAPSVESQRRDHAEAYMRRGLLGTKRMEDRGEHRG